jgi:hypothetical protein
MMASARLAQVVTRLLNSVRALAPCLDLTSPASFWMTAPTGLTPQKQNNDFLQNHIFIRDATNNKSMISFKIMIFV